MPTPRTHYIHQAAQVTKGLNHPPIYHPPRIENWRLPHQVEIFETSSTVAQSSSQEMHTETADSKDTLYSLNSPKTPKVATDL